MAEGGEINGVEDGTVSDVPADGIHRTETGEIDIYRYLYGSELSDEEYEDPEVPKKLSFRDLIALQKEHPELGDDILLLLEQEGLDVAYQEALIIPPQPDLEVARTEDGEIDFDYYANLGFDELKRLEHSAPHVIQALQQELSDRGLYVSEDHRFYNDGKIGLENQSVTWRGIQLAAGNGLELAQASIADSTQQTFLDPIESLHMQQALNRIAIEAADETQQPQRVNVDGRMDAQTTNALLEYIDAHKDLLNTASLQTMRVLNSHIPAERLDSLVTGNERASELLETARTTKQTCFDPSQFGSREEQTYAAVTRAVAYQGGDEAGARTLGAFAYIEARYGNHPLTYKANPMAGSSATGIMQQTRTYTLDRYAQFGNQLSPEGQGLGRSEILALRHDDYLASQLTYLENESNIPKITDDAEFTLNSGLGSQYDAQTHLTTHQYIVHNIGAGGHNMLMGALQTNPDGSFYDVLQAKGHTILARNNPSFYFENGRELSAREVYERYIEEIQTGLDYHDSVAAKFDPTPEATLVASAQTSADPAPVQAPTRSG